MGGREGFRAEEGCDSSLISTGTPFSSCPAPTDSWRQHWFGPHLPQQVMFPVSTCPASLVSLVTSSLGPSWELPPCILVGVQKRRDTRTHSHSSLRDLLLGPAKWNSWSETTPEYLWQNFLDEVQRDMRFRWWKHWKSAWHRSGGASPKPQASHPHHVTVGGCQHHMHTVLSGWASGWIPRFPFLSRPPHVASGTNGRTTPFLNYLLEA